jgi:hypothetical protein
MHGRIAEDTCQGIRDDGWVKDVQWRVCIWYKELVVEGPPPTHGSNMDTARAAADDPSGPFSTRLAGELISAG